MLNIVSAMILASFNLGSFVQGSVNDGVGTTGFRHETEVSLLSPEVDLDFDGSGTDLRFEELRLPQVMVSEHFGGLAAADDVDIVGTQRSIPIDLEPSVGRGAADTTRTATVIIESLSGSVHLIATEVID
jgi:hypothetical protein